MNKQDFIKRLQRINGDITYRLSDSFPQDCRQRGYCAAHYAASHANADLSDPHDGCAYEKAVPALRMVEDIMNS